MFLRYYPSYEDLRWGFSKVWLKGVGKVHWVWSHETLGNQSKNERVAITWHNRKTFGSYKVFVEWIGKNDLISIKYRAYSDEFYT